MTDTGTPTPPAPAAPSPPSLLAPALTQLERGDHRGAAGLLAAVLAGKPEPEVERAARALEERMAPDPAALAVGIASLVLLLFVTIHYLF